MKPKPTRLILRRMFDFAFWILSEVKIYGQEHIPLSGPVLLVVNHMSYADPPLIFITVRRNDMIVLAADSYKSNPFFHWLIDELDGVWINRGAGDRAALKATMEVLKQGHLLGMAPEGTRSKTGRLTQGKTGTAFIATKTGAPILPIGLSGTDVLFAGLRRLRRGKLTVRIGPTFTLPPLEGPAPKSELLEQYTHEVMCRLAALLPDWYHGLYQGDPRIEAIRRETGIRVDK